MPILETLSVEQLKYVYNRYLARYLKAEMFFEEHIEQYDKWEDNFIAVINVMGLTLEELQKRGIAVSQEEIEYGFWNDT